MLLVALALLVAPKPLIVQKPIPFPPARRAETAVYAQRHYGLDTWRLNAPHVIVEHYTATTMFSSAWNTFAADSPDPELGERPGHVRALRDRPGRDDLPARAARRRSAAIPSA